MTKRLKKRLVTNEDLHRMGVKTENLSGAQLIQLMEGKPIEWPIDPDLPSPPKEPLGDQVRDMIVVGLRLMGGLLLFASAFILALQALVYLKTGAWPRWVLFTAFEEFIPISFHQWLMSPQDWFGFHQVVSYLFMEMPLALSIFLLAILLAIALGLLEILF